MFYIGTIALPQSDEAECWCLRCLSLSREVDLSIEGMAAARGVECSPECGRVGTSRCLRPRRLCRNYRVDKFEDRELYAGIGGDASV